MPDWVVDLIWLPVREKFATLHEVEEYWTLEDCAAARMIVVQQNIADTLATLNRKR